MLYIIDIKEYYIFKIFFTNFPVELIADEMALGLTKWVDYAFRRDYELSTHSFSSYQYLVRSRLFIILDYGCILLQPAMN